MVLDLNTTKVVKFRLKNRDRNRPIYSTYNTMEGKNSQYYDGSSLLSHLSIFMESSAFNIQVKYCKIHWYVRQ